MSVQLGEPQIARMMRWFWGGALAVASLGVVADLRWGCEYFQRSGKVIVALALLATYGQFVYERRFLEALPELKETVRDRLKEKGLSGTELSLQVSRESAEMKKAMEEARRKILITALLAAGSGEVIAAFGDFAVMLLRH
jgi:hypothetical protein